MGGGVPTAEEQARARLAALQPTQQQIQERQAAAKHAQDVIDQAKRDPAVIAKNDEIRAKNEAATNQVIFGTCALLGGFMCAETLGANLAGAKSVDPDPNSKNGISTLGNFLASIFGGGTQPQPNAAPKPSVFSV